MKRPPYLIRSVSRQGVVRWYVWRRPALKVRIQGEYGSREFMAAYRAALFGEKEPEKPTGKPKSLSALISAYKRSPAWVRLSEATQKQRRGILDKADQKLGDMPAAEVDSGMVRIKRDALGPGAAKHFVQTIRGLFKWGMEMEYVDHDPTEGVKVSRPKTDGFETWSEDDINAYLARWPMGTRERLWLGVLLHTGLRRGDAVSIGPGHIRNGAIAFTAEKTGTPIHIPLASELAEIIAASPVGTQTFIATVHGKPMSKEFFGNLFREACDKAGVKKSAHGLRKAAAVRLAEAGATVPELNSVFGWTGAKQALLYIEKADRARLARSAMERLKK